jgi:aromatic ring-opening dioxygenase LigB subunit
MLVFSAIAPHSPLLIPSIGKEHRESLNATLDAYRLLEEHLYATKPDTLVLISSHAAYYPDGFSCNISPAYTGNLKEFGDHGTTVTTKGDSLFIDRLHRHLRQTEIPFSLMSEETLDYGMTIALTLLLPHLPNVKIVPLSISGLSNEEHAKFSQEVMQVIHEDTRRIAFIATADLSHHANAQSTQGVNEAGPAFEQAVKKAIEQVDPSPLVALSPEILKDAAQCGAQPIVTLLGAIQKLHMKPTILCYEAPFGVGQLTAEFELL